jgi:hypothetical protein
MKRKYIKPTTEVLASIVQPIMGGVSGIPNSDQNDDGGAAARGTDFMVDDESEDSRYNLWEE